MWRPALLVAWALALLATSTALRPQASHATGVELQEAVSPAKGPTLRRPLRHWHSVAPKGSLFRSDAPKQKALVEHLNVVIVTNRLEPLHALLTSIYVSTKSSTRIYLWIILDNAVEIVDQRFSSNMFAGISLVSLRDVEEDLAAQGLEVLWRWEEYGSSNKAGWVTNQTLRRRKWDDDRKHLSPFNLVRFYLPHLRWFELLDNLVLLDDDVIVQQDMSILMNVETLPGKALISTCDTWGWDLKRSVPKWYKGTKLISSTGALYMDIDKDRNRSRRLFAPYIESLNNLDEGVLDREIDWNFGISVYDLANWRANKVTEVWMEWMEANYDSHLVEERSIVFGLGLGQLALLDRHQCLSEVQIAEGLGWVQLKDLERNGLDAQTFVQDAFALHYAGLNKPWDRGAANKLPAAFRRPYLDAVWASGDIARIFDQGRSNLPLSPVLIQKALQSTGHISPN